MMKKSFIYFVLILSNLFAQSFTGYIKDVSGEPVSFVIIEEINSNLEEKNCAMSDENGVFTINVQSNSQLSFDIAKMFLLRAISYLHCDFQRPIVAPCI